MRKHCKGFYSADLQLEETDINKVQILRIGTFEYWDADLVIDETVLREMKMNFDRNVRKTDLAIDYSHNSHLEAAGWIREVILENNDSELWAVVDWTDEASEKIKSKEYRYLSADISFKYKDNETGEEFGTVLNGAGLTNRPFIKGMNAILSELTEDVDLSQEKRDAIKEILNDEAKPIKKGTKQMELSELKGEIAKLSEQDKEALGVITETKIAELAEKRAESAEIKVKDLTAELAEVKKGRAFEVLLDAGKACEAQREAFMSGDMAKFAEGAVKINLDAKGDGSSEGKETEKVDTKEKAEAKVLELSEAKRKENAALSVGEAQTAVLQENPDLNKLIYGDV